LRGGVRERAGAAARAAVLHVVVEVDLAAGAGVLIAVGEARVAGDRAGGVGAAGRAVGAVAGVAARAAVLHVDGGVDLAAGGRHLVAVGEAGAAAGDGA